MNDVHSLQRDASQFLDRVVVELLNRTTVAPSERPARLGALFVLEDAIDIERVLNAPQVFEKDFGLVAAVGPSRFNMNGADWVNLRAKTQRHYAKAGKPSYLSVYRDIYDAELSALETADHAGLETAISRAALRCFFYALGIQVNVADFLPHFRDLRTMAELLQFRSWIAASEASSELTTLSRELTRIRVALWDTCQDSPELVALFNRFATQGDPFPVETIFSDFLTNMFAGIETTTSSLLWMIDCLSRSPDVQTALRADAHAQIDARIDGFRDETMRLFSPIPFVVRKLSHPARFGETSLQAGEMVLISLVGLHRDPRYWSTPHEFRAGRPEFQRTAPSDNVAFRPFLTGPRVCGGRRIAEMEINVGLRLILTHFELNTRAQQTGFRYSLAFRPVLTEALEVTPITAPPAPTHA
ncbi:cytochrome P450 [Celeribacter sp.]|uniref:cytochrome P450 n=1 Tax=Celeribacter sp. TaxID=1890673 RepID=UPI003A8FE963